ncbi:MAG: PLP-dependent aminotransferase family protein [Gemmatimonadaceae bacterium]|nr:PLP-dependent aminotransferase family protein [Gemmatimonadaceae bacterium]MCC6432989.1 PLP-dependent aminotransferase family protein [Gemmatimonadaceae bacterium]
MTGSIDDGLIDFGNGQPSLSLLPVEMLRTATEHFLRAGDATLLQYGADQGDASFRDMLAAFLSRRYRGPIDASELMISGSASHALDLVCARCTQPGDTIFVEEPTYFLALHVFRDHGLHVVGIPIDEHGIRIDALRDALRQHRPALLYTIPSFQNPSGTTMSAERRAQLVEVSQAHDLLIVADEVYHLLDFDTPPPPPLAMHVSSARIVSLGSFSKICAPGLRLGWIHGATPMLQTLMRAGVVQSGGGFNPFVSGIMRSMIELGLADTCLDGLRRVYAERTASLCAALRTEFANAHFVEPHGGYFVWLRLPARTDASRLRPEATRHGVSYHAGSRFVGGDGFSDYVRLSFAHYEPPTLAEGVRRLAHVAARFAVDRHR